MVNKIGLPGRTDLAFEEIILRKTIIKNITKTM